MTRIKLKAADGHVFGAYEAVPKRPPRAGVIVLQEIFGVNDHIASICDRLAEAGYHAVAPALFDRFAPDFRSGYSPEEVQTARGMMGQLDWDAMILDSLATYRHLRLDSVTVAAVGFCLGGSLAYRLALRPDCLVAAVCFYGGDIVNQADHAPTCPTQLHYGDADHTIPMSDVEKVRAKRPECDIHVYQAGHGFHCDARASYEPNAAAPAWTRTLEWLEKYADD